MKKKDPKIYNRKKIKTLITNVRFMLFREAYKYEFVLLNKNDKKRERRTKQKTERNSNFFNVLSIFFHLTKNFYFDQRKVKKKGEKNAAEFYEFHLF